MSQSAHRSNRSRPVRAHLTSLLGQRPPVWMNLRRDTIASLTCCELTQLMSCGTRSE
jgi:hypothetical protein